MIKKDKIDFDSRKIKDNPSIIRKIKKDGPQSWTNLSKEGFTNSKLQCRINELKKKGVIKKVNKKYVLGNFNEIMSIYFPKIIHQINLFNLQKRKPSDLFYNSKVNPEKEEEEITPIFIYGLPKEKLSKNELKEIKNCIKIIDDANNKINKIAQKKGVKNLFLCTMN